jgi:hypothetical protein
VRGVARDVSPSSGNRLICYCDDCQAFARFLGHAEIMDSAGGTDIFQMAPARFEIAHEADALRCLRLSPKGLFRWYTDCCRTPVGNTLPRFPFVGVIHSFMDHAGDGRSRDEVLGEPLGAIHVRFALGALPPGAPRKASLGVIGRSARMMLGWWVGGLGKPTPFFEPGTRAPRVAPRVLTASERAALAGSHVA